MLIKDLAQIDAENVRREYWDGIFPVDPIVITRRMGVDTYMSDNLGDTSGLIVRPANEPAKIYVNQFESKARQRLTCAHEIGHYVERTRNEGNSYSNRANNLSLSHSLTILLRCASKWRPCMP